MKTAKFFAAVIILGASFAQGQIRSTCTVNGNTAECTSTDDGAAIAERNRQYAEAGNQMGQALGAAILRARQAHAERAENKRYYKQRAEEWCAAHGTKGQHNPFTNKKCSQGQEAAKPEAEAFCMNGVVGCAKPEAATPYETWLAKQKADVNKKSMDALKEAFAASK